MQIKTQGVVLNSTKYNDKYSLVHIYTKHTGRMVYMVYRTKSRNKRVPANLFTPLNLLEIDAEHFANRDIHRIKEVHNLFPYSSIPGSIQKTSIQFFIAEFLSKVLKDATDTHLTFSFVSESMKVLELAQRSCANFHLVFMVRLMHFLGIYPHVESYAKGYSFDLMLGEFVCQKPLHPHYIPSTESHMVVYLHRMTFKNMHLFKLTRQQRQEITSGILDYYKIHIQDFPLLKSVEILPQLF